MISPWIHIVPKGELPNKAAGVVQVLDDQALQAIYDNLEAERKSQGDRWPGLYGGREHHIYEANADSEAFAWFKKFEIRPDGLYAHSAGLTESGRQELGQGKYKFTSFVTNPAKPGSIEDLGGNRRRILKIDTVGFTNLPNGKDLLKPIWNRAQQDSAKLNPQEAAQELLLLANRLQADQGLSFSQAWHQARHELPHLVEALEQQPVSQASPAASGNEILRGVHPDCAARALLRLANRHELECNVTFEAAWQQVQLQHPRLAQTMAQMDSAEARLLNRQPQFQDRETENLWNLAESVEAAAMEAMQKPIKMYRDGNGDRSEFQSELQALQSGSGFTFEEAWQHLKANNPQLWFSAMMETPEVRRITGGQGIALVPSLSFLSK